MTRVTDEGLIIELFDTPDAPLFVSGGARPTQVMRDLARLISRVSDLVTNDIAVEAHVRARPLVLASNPVWGLSTDRANQFRRLLRGFGTDPARLRRVTGHADREAAVTDPMAIRNNRVEVILLRD